MTKRARLANRADREPVIAGVLIEAIEEQPPQGPCLVVDDDTGLVTAALGGLGVPTLAWNRRAVLGRPAAPWPGPFEAPPASAVVRLARDWPSFGMQLEAVAACGLPARAPLLLYGPNDEGIRTAQKRLLQHAFEQPFALLVKRRSRVVRAQRAADVRARTLADFASRVPVSLPAGGGEHELLAYPGVFSRGKLDDGTRLLLEALAQLAPRRRVLDFGAGVGIVGLWAREAWPGCQLDLVDLDAVSLAAAEHNVPGARLVLSDGWSALPQGRYDAILSNPPLHRGHEEDLGVLTELVRGARDWLVPGGVLALVVQRSVGLGTLFEATFPRARVLAESTSFQVWCGTR